MSFKFLFFLLTIFAGLTVKAADWGLPNPPSAGIGEEGTLFLTEPGMVFDIHNNDWIGQTDKLLTFSSNISYFKTLQTKGKDDAGIPEAFSVSLGSRLLTPITKVKFGEPYLHPPIGILAEWLALQLAYSRLFGRFKLELAYEGDFFGNYHGDAVYRYIHTIVNSPDDWDRYGQRFEGTYASYNVGLGYIWSDWLLSMAYYSNSVIMEEYTIATNFIYRFNESLSFAAENRFVMQTTSHFYDEVRPYRHEWGVAIKWGFWQANAKYVSPYLERDRYGQYFLSPLVLNWRF
ncbi:MAG TPA: hypothetical protein VF412_04895 [Bdellovibrio sp.]|uniref:hypothetical protein n=1 Tax=Bdellovibrio sp. TaxID=28201 RepID=UPI002F1DB126